MYTSNGTRIHQTRDSGCRIGKDLSQLTLLFHFNSLQNVVLSVCLEGMMSVVLKDVPHFV